MALVDFFTPTEMKNGLVAVGRVEELVSAMQKEKDSSVKSVDEKARQWSTVANALAATESMSVLKHFVQLGGLVFLDQWLQEALQHSNSTGDSSLDGSTCELLRALEKFYPDNKAPVFSGIMLSVKNLIGHKSSRVQERVKSLYDLLSHGMEKECSHLDSDKSGECDDVVKTSNATVSLASSTVEHPTVNVYPAESGTDGEKQTILLSGNNLIRPISLDCSQSASMKQNFSGTTHGQVDVNDPIIKVTPVQPSQHLVEESCTDLAGGTSSAGTWRKSAEKNSDKFVGTGISCVSSSSGADLVTPVNTLDMQSVAEPAVVTGADVKKNERSVRKALPTVVESNTSTEVSNPSGDVEVGFGVPKHSRTDMELSSLEDNALDSQDHRTTGQNVGIFSNESHDLSVTGCISRKMENINTSFLGEVKDLNVSAPDMLKKDERCEDSETMGGISKPTTNMTADEMVKSRMNVKHEVAKAAAQEIPDYKEPLCSVSSKENLEATVVEPGSPDSVNDKQYQPISEQQNKMPGEQKISGASISSKGEDHLIDSKNEDKPEDSACKQSLSRVIEAVQEAAKQKSDLGFDLNENSNSEEMEQIKTLISSMPAASTSKAIELEWADAPTCQREGKATCSGSVTTALCPAASVLGIQDAQKALSVEGGTSLKQRQAFMDIDLNVADDNNDGTTYAMLEGVPESSGLPSGESSVEVCSNKAKKLKLDLNSSVDEGNNTSSPASWYSAMRPFMRNLDLNDNPHESQGHPSDHDVVSSQDRNACGGLHPDGQFVIIMGKRVPIPREDVIPLPREDVIPQTRSFLPSQPDVSHQTKSFLSSQPDVTHQTRSFFSTEPDVTPQTRSFLSKEPVPVSSMPDETPQTRSFLSKEPIPESSMYANYAQSGGVAQTYVPLSPGFGYNNHHMEPFMSLSSEMYASAVPPYTVDPRAIPTRPQPMDSFIAVPPSYSRSPFPISTPSAPSGFNWIERSQPNLDVSSGLFITGVENREQGTSTSRQVSFPGQANMVEEQTGSSSQFMRLKRREPDNGCDPHPGVYRRQPPWL